MVYFSPASNSLFFNLEVLSLLPLMVQPMRSLAVLDRNSFIFHISRFRIHKSRNDAHIGFYTVSFFKPFAILVGIDGFRSCCNRGEVGTDSPGLGVDVTRVVDDESPHFSP